MSDKDKNTNQYENDENQSINSSPAFSFLTAVQPTHLLLVSSLPLCIGAYAGYRLELNRSASASASAAAESYSPGFTSSGSGLLKRVVGEEVLSSNAGAATKKGSVVKAATTIAGEQSQALMNVNPARVAFKALGVGSLLSVGGFGLLTFVVFKATGSDTLDDLIDKCRKWTPKKRVEFERKMGINPKSMQHEDVKATEGMTEEEEWEFIKKKYIPELVVEEQGKK